MLIYPFRLWIRIVESGYFLKGPGKSDGPQNARELFIFLLITIILSIVCVIIIVYLISFVKTLY